MPLSLNKIGSVPNFDGPKLNDIIAGEDLQFLLYPSNIMATSKDTAPRTFEQTLESYERKMGRTATSRNDILFFFFFLPVKRFALGVLAD